MESPLIRGIPEESGPAEEKRYESKVAHERSGQIALSNPCLIGRPYQLKLEIRCSLEARTPRFAMRSMIDKPEMNGPDPCR